MTPIHILIIDDNVANLMVLSGLLTRHGYVCTIANDPRGVENMLTEIDPVDLIFLDLEMPDLNGYEIFEMLRPMVGDIPIIAHSIHDNELNTVSSVGFDGFVGKPLNPTRFGEQIARILRGESVWERA